MKVVALILAMSSSFAFAQMKISGASTVGNFIKDMIPAVEKDSGVKLDIQSSNTGLGLVDLAAGKVEMSMTSEPLDIAVKAGTDAGASLKASDLKIHQIAEAEVVFAVHPSNAVSKLTWAQIKDIHTGKITNWKDVGGKDAGIVLYAEHKSAGTRNLIKKIVVKGEEFAASAKEHDSIKKVAEAVAADANGFAGVGEAFAKEAKLKVVETNKVFRPLGFLTKGEPSANAAKVIEAFKKAAKK